MLKHSYFWIVFATIALLGLNRTFEEPFGVRVLLAAEQEQKDHPSFESARPTQALLTEIVTWLSDHYDLPANYTLPEFKFLPALELASVYRQALAQERINQNGINEPAVQGSGLIDIVAFYNDKTKTIFLADTWNGGSATEVSVLVHEMVHHLQNVGKLKYECAAAREKTAYLAQEAWLNRHGLDLEQEFEIDKFSLLIKTSCVF